MCDLSFADPGNPEKKTKRKQDQLKTHRGRCSLIILCSAHKRDQIRSESGAPVFTLYISPVLLSFSLPTVPNEINPEHKHRCRFGVLPSRLRCRIGISLPDKLCRDSLALLVWFVIAQANIIVQEHSNAPVAFIRHTPGARRQSGVPYGGTVIYSLAFHYSILRNVEPHNPQWLIGSNLIGRFINYPYWLDVS